MGFCHRINMIRCHRRFAFTISIYLACILYLTEVTARSDEISPNRLFIYPRLYEVAFAKDNYLRPGGRNYKRSIAILAKNGLLPTYKTPYSNTDEIEDYPKESHEKRNFASVDRFRNVPIKTNVQSLGSEYYFKGRQYSQPLVQPSIEIPVRNEKSRSWNEEVRGGYYYPYPNFVRLLDSNEPLNYKQASIYQRSNHPHYDQTLQQIFKRSDVDFEQTNFMNKFDNNTKWSNKRGVNGLPVQGLIRPIFLEASSPEAKRSTFSIFEIFRHEDIIPDGLNRGEKIKRSVGSIPLTRISCLGNIDLIPELADLMIQTTPAYGIRQRSSIEN